MSHTFFQIQFIIRNLKIWAWISSIRDADTAAKISLKISGGSDTTIVTSVLPQAALMPYQLCLRHRWCHISVVSGSADAD